MLLAAFAMATFVIVGCKKTDKGPTYSMTATVGSHSFSATGLSVNANNSGGSLALAGVTSTYESISFGFFTPTVTVGTYPIDSTGNDIFGYESALGVMPVSGASGSVTFTAVTPNLVGTFNVTLTDGTKITDGKFTIKSPF